MYSDKETNTDTIDKPKRTTNIATYPKPLDADFRTNCNAHG